MQNSTTPLSHILKDLMNYSEVKRLAYSLVALQQKKRFRSLSVLSCFPAEGKTLFCAAMAMAYAETTQTRVLVVDTTNSHNPGSLLLKACLDPSMPLIDVLSLSKDHIEFSDQREPAMSTRFAHDRSSSIEAVVMEKPRTLSISSDNDRTLLHHVVNDGSKHYGLALLDTVPLAAKNKGNVDPYLAASQSDASVLLVSRKLMQSPDIKAHLKLLRNPALRLVGIVSNEEFLS